MTDRPLAKPDGLTDEGLFKARTEKVMFVNPPGYENYARSKSFGKSLVNMRDDEKHTFVRDPGSFRDFDRTKLGHIRGFGEGKLSVNGRPVK